MTSHNAASFVSRVGVFELDDARGTIYAQIADTLTSAITSGRLLPGDRLPAERHLATELGVSRDTIRQALAELQRHGQLVRTVGRAGGLLLDGAGGPLEFSRDIFRGDRTRMVVWGSEDHDVLSQRYADH